MVVIVCHSQLESHGPPLWSVVLKSFSSFSVFLYLRFLIDKAWPVVLSNARTSTSTKEPPPLYRVHVSSCYKNFGRPQVFWIAPMLNSTLTWSRNVYDINCLPRIFFFFWTCQAYLAEKVSTDFKYLHTVLPPLSLTYRSESNLPINTVIIGLHSLISLSICPRTLSPWNVVPCALDSDRSSSSVFPLLIHKKVN